MASAAKADPSRIARLCLVIAGLVAVWWAVIIVDEAPHDPIAIEQVRELDGALVNAPARDFLLHDLDGNPHTLSSLRGQVVFLNFWATWCPPCREEMPSMHALAAAYRDRAFRMIAVTQDQDPAALVSFLRETGMTGDDVLILQDPNGELTAAYGTRLLPETYMIDRSGQVFARFMGPRDWSSEASIRLVERLLAADGPA